MHCAIIGAGISGLSAAYALEQICLNEEIACRIDLFEASQRVGGVIQTEHAYGQAIELGPDSLVDRQRGAVELCRRLGLEHLLVSINPEAKPPLVRSLEGWRPFPSTETRSFGLSGGLDQLPRALAGAFQKTTLHLETPIYHVSRGEQGWQVNDKGDHYAVIVLAIPATKLQAIVEQQPGDWSWIQQVEYQPRAVVAGVYDSEAFSHSPLINHTGFIVQPDTGLGLTAVTWLSTKWGQRRDSDPIVVRTFWGPPGPNPEQWDDTALKQQHESSLDVLVGSHNAPLWTTVRRYRHALPKVPPGLSWEPTYTIDGTYRTILGPFREGLGVSDCVRLAWEEAYSIVQWASSRKTPS